MIYMHPRKYISALTKLKILEKQKFKCANEPGSNLKGLSGYDCILWKFDKKNPGLFGEEGYEIDHIEEYCISQNNSLSNLQALCHSCHSVKTKRFMSSLYKHKKKDNKNNKDDKNTRKNNIGIKIITLTAKFKCERCPYTTNDKQKYNNHINRKIPCFLSSQRGDVHGNTKKNKIYYCKICKQNFTKNSSLTRHNKTFHEVVNDNDNKKINNKQIIGNNNEKINGNNKKINGNNNTTINIKNMIIQL